MASNLERVTRRAVEKSAIAQTATEPQQQAYFDHVAACSACNAAAHKRAVDIAAHEAKGLELVPYLNSYPPRAGYGFCGEGERLVEASVEAYLALYDELDVS